MRLLIKPSTNLVKINILETQPLSDAEKTTVCVVCGKNSRFAIKQSGYDHYKCSECSLLFVHPMPGEEFLRTKVYGADTSISKEKILLDWQSANPSESQKRVLDWLCTKKETHRRLLDIGCSSGRFMEWCKQSGIESFGIELNPDKASIGKAMGLNIHSGEFSESPWREEKFDFIYLGDVIEHLPSPDAFIKNCSGNLSAQGYFIFITPNVNCFYGDITFLIHKFTGLSWSVLTPPYHLCNFSLKSISALMESNGYQSVSTYYEKHQCFSELANRSMIMLKLRRIRFTGYLLGRMLETVARIVTLLSRLVSLLIYRNDFYMLVIFRRKLYRES
jgi:2-polyprenyl-3-methyl-5-hydroxy-6-metoxy-1,4-benzoquinol methylase